MSTCSMLPAVGLSLVVAWGAQASGAGTDGALTGGVRQTMQVAAAGNPWTTTQPAEAGEVIVLDDVPVEELAAIERSCRAPLWGESAACAAFALAAGASVEIELKEVLDDSGKKQDEKIKFRLYDVKGQKTVSNFELSVGSKHTFTNGTEGILDLVVHTRGQSTSDARNVRFTYTK
jgi:hypothetical protein